MTKREKYTFYAIAVIVSLLLCILLGGIRVQSNIFNNSHPHYSKIEVRVGTFYKTWLYVSIFTGEKSGSGIVLRVLVKDELTLITFKEITWRFVDGNWKSESRITQLHIDYGELPQ